MVTTNLGLGLGLRNDLAHNADLPSRGIPSGVSGNKPTPLRVNLGPPFAQIAGANLLRACRLPRQCAIRTLHAEHGRDGKPTHVAMLKMLVKMHGKLQTSRSQCAHEAPTTRSQGAHKALTRRSRGTHGTSRGEFQTLHAENRRDGNNNKRR